MSTARQAAERIAKDTTPWYGLTRANPDWVEEVVQKAIDSATAELKAKYYRSLEDITRERDEARDELNKLRDDLRGVLMISEGWDEDKCLARWPWLKWEETL